MPELPEVEVVRQSLNKIIKQKKVKKIIVRNRNLRQKIPLNFASLLKNQKILKVDRFSKYLILHFASGIFCLIHLGMSGTIHIIKKKKTNSITNASFYSFPFLPKKHSHIEIFFEKCKIVYNDPRRFGFFEIIKNSKFLEKRFSNLGPEPFQSKFNLEYVNSFLKKKEKNIKNFLLDQKFVSGIGNIYACEILFLSKINPSKKACLLKKEDYLKIIKNSKKILLDAINKGGSSIKDFKNITGNKGSFQKNFNVYEREGFDCKRKNCLGVIKKKKIGQRSTFFCNCCQN